MTHRVGWAEARAAAFAATSALPAEAVSVLSCVGRTLARDVLALQNVPHFASAAMDGWAVSGDSPWQLVARDQAGENRTMLVDGTAHPIVTGAVIHPDVTAVVRREHGWIDGTRLRLRSGVDSPAPGGDIRGPATEAITGDVLVRAGVSLNPAHAAVAAAGGHDTVEVARRARVALVTTGAEIVASGVPEPGFVRDSFGPMLPAAVAGFSGGAQVVSHVRLGDDRRQLLDTIQTVGVDVVVTTGGTATSPVDHLRSVLDELGAAFIVDTIDVRPGAPSMLAQLASGVFVVALPGNPLAAMTGALLLLEPVLAGLAAHPLTESGEVVVGDGHESGRVRLMPYRLVDAMAVASGWQGSGMLRGLADAQGVMVVPAEGLKAGNTASSLALPWPV